MTGHFICNSDILFDDKRHLLFIFAGKNHFDLGNEVNTAAKCQSWYFSLKAGSREIHHEDKAEGFRSMKAAVSFGPLQRP